MNEPNLFCSPQRIHILMQKRIIEGNARKVTKKIIENHESHLLKIFCERKGTEAVP